MARRGLWRVPTLLSGAATGTPGDHVEVPSEVLFHPICTGRIDAVYQAIDMVVQVKATLLEYRVAAITEGIDALGEVTVRVRRDENGKRSFGGHGADTDIIVASAKADLQALNKAIALTGEEGAAVNIAADDQLASP